MIGSVRISKDGLTGGVIWGPVEYVVCRALGLVSFFFGRGGGPLLRGSAYKAILGSSDSYRRGPERWLEGISGFRVTLEV